MKLLATEKVMIKLITALVVVFTPYFILMGIADCLREIAPLIHAIAPSGLIH